MNVDKRVLGILEAAQEGVAPNRDECVFLLQFPETSLEAALLRAVADASTRRRFNNSGILFGQIGVDIAACPGKCKFCAFGEGHTTFEPSVMSDEEILHGVDDFTNTGELYALFLMTMHTFDFERLTRIVQKALERIPRHTQLIVNIGDLDAAQVRDLKAAGVSGAYHVCRLREGSDTALDPEQRKATIRIIKEAGLDWYYCCEPIGPEHSAEELADQIFIGVEYGCFQHAAMRRVYVPSTPLAPRGQISELRLAQVTAVVTLATLTCPETKTIAVHEPNLLGLTAGANAICAESGANPRDLEKETLGRRGRDVNACRMLLYEAGFERFLISPTESISLADAYRCVRT